MRNSHPTRRIMITVALAILLAACGQKGQLRLPDPPPPAPAVATPDAPPSSGATSEDPTGLAARRGNPHE